MTTDILPDILARAITDSVKRAAAEAPGNAIEARNIALLARHCEYMLQESQAVAAEAKELVTKGVEASVLRRRSESALESIGQDLDAADHVLQLAERGALGKQGDPGVAHSRQAVEKVRQELVTIRGVFLGYLEVLNRPLPLIDWESLEEESRADREAGAYVRYETAEDIMRDFGGL